MLIVCTKNLSQSDLMDCKIITLEEEEKVFLVGSSTCCQLFIGSTYLDKGNMILIDGSHEKCVCNDSDNCLFLQTWSPPAVSNDILFVLLLSGHFNCIPRAVAGTSGIL
jgi:hypothetical protein